MADFRFSFFGEHINPRHAVGIVLLRDFGNHPPRELRMGAFAGQVIALQEIGKHFIRKHVHRLLGPAGPYPAVFHEGVYPGIGVGAVDIQFVRRYPVMQRFAVKIIQYQYVPDRQPHGSPPSRERADEIVIRMHKPIPNFPFLIIIQTPHF